MEVALNHKFNARLNRTQPRPLPLLAITDVLQEAGAWGLSAMTRLIACLVGADIPLSMSSPTGVAALISIKASPGKVLLITTDKANRHQTTTVLPPPNLSNCSEYLAPPPIG
eukprot:GFKZ01003853.1.p1 GENE.GFKZ01003853.1~~GFKZ01003853.1.p1  ORF type:complete len:112 (-),score=5.10 GFKZ01003853.1:46-381(-)